MNPPSYEQSIIQDKIDNFDDVDNNTYYQIAIGHNNYGHPQINYFTCYVIVDEKEHIVEQHTFDTDEIPDLKQWLEASNHVNVDPMSNIINILIKFYGDMSFVSGQGRHNSHYNSRSQNSIYWTLYFKKGKGTLAKTNGRPCKRINIPADTNCAPGYGTTNLALYFD
jgi:hypothetical protein